jgi:ribonuclease HI
MFDGASSGNPGPAGAGAVLYAEDWSLVSNLCNNSIGYYIVDF